MNHQACRLQNLELQIAVRHLYAPRIDGHPDIQVAAEVYYPENVDGYYCESCSRFFGVKRDFNEAATEERVQQAWRRALHHLHAVAYGDPAQGEALPEAMPPEELAKTTGALLASLPVAAAKGDAL